MKQRDGRGHKNGCGGTQASLEGNRRSCRQCRNVGAVRSAATLCGSGRANATGRSARRVAADVSWRLGNSNLGLQISGESEDPRVELMPAQLEVTVFGRAGSSGTLHSATRFPLDGAGLESLRVGRGRTIVRVARAGRSFSCRGRAFSALASSAWGEIHRCGPRTSMDPRAFPVAPQSLTLMIALTTLQSMTSRGALWRA